MVASAPTPLMLLVQASSLVERIPTLLELYRCAGHGVNITFIVLRAEQARCCELCAADASYANATSRQRLQRPCGCHPTKRLAKLTSHNDMVHPYATGQYDLLFMHADMWVNVAALMQTTEYQSGRVMMSPIAAGTQLEQANARRSSEQPMAIASTSRPVITSSRPSSSSTGASTSGTITADPDDDGRTESVAQAFSARPTCVPLAAMRNCTRVRHGANAWWQRCGNSTWSWWKTSHTTCLRAAEAWPSASPLKPRACCYGWSDLLFLPAKVHEAYRGLAHAFRRTFHEVAIPTILNALASPSTGYRWAPDATTCLGGCCARLPWNQNTQHAVCAHRIALQEMAKFGSGNERGMGHRSWVRCPHAGHASS